MNARYNHNEVDLLAETRATLNPIVEVLVFTTGGTIEKTYDESDGSLENRESVIRHDIAATLRLPYTRLEIKALMSKDSLLMGDEDRAAIAAAIANHQALGRPIVVLHGTDTMELSARYCAQHLPNLSVPVVFTGAMKPIGFRDSDAIQNVTEALMAAKIVRPGVYISFHNRLYPGARASKNRSLNTFEEVGTV